MNPTARRILSVIGGLFVGMIVIGLLEFLGHRLFPLPEDLDTNDMEAMATYISTAPIGALLWVIFAWAVGAFSGGAAAALLGKEAKRTAAYIIGGVLTFSSIFNITMIPHPPWFWIGVLVFVPAALAGWKIVPDQQNA